MTAKYYTEGLMARTSKADKDQILEQIKTLFGDNKEDLTLEEQLARLSPAQVQQLKMQLPLLRLHSQLSRQADPYVTHAQVLDRHYRGMKASDKALYAELLEGIDPTPEAPADYVPKAAKPKRNYTAEYQDKFLQAQAQSESSGNPKAEITNSDGRRFTGKLQFSQARLDDYMQATGTSFTQDDFMASEALQDEVANWHVANINKAIDALGDAAEEFSRDGLRAVAHLGGKGGMAKWVETGGGYDPEDELGTSLSEYYLKFSGLA